MSEDKVIDAEGSEEIAGAGPAGDESLARCSGCNEEFAATTLVDIMGRAYCASCRDKQIQIMLQSMRTESRGKPPTDPIRLVNYLIAFVVLLLVLVLVPMFYATVVLKDNTTRLGASPSSGSPVQLARARLLRIASALQAWYADHGEYPRELSELPFDDGSTLIDPFNRAGQQFHYRREPEGRNCRVYSLGPDRRNDSGRPLEGNEGTGDVVIAGKFGRTSLLGGPWPEATP